MEEISKRGGWLVPVGVKYEALQQTGRTAGEEISEHLHSRRKMANGSYKHVHILASVTALAGVCVFVQLQKGEGFF